MSAFAMSLICRLFIDNHIESCARIEWSVESWNRLVTWPSGGVDLSYI